MKKLFICLIIFMVPLVGICEMFLPSKEKMEQMIMDKYKMKCKAVHKPAPKIYRIVVRCENKEVVCYHMAEGGMQCKFK